MNVEPEMVSKCSYSEIVPIDVLRPNPKNPNKHSNEQIERLKQIIAYQGFRHPIIVSKRSGFIVAGHGRLLAAMRLGFKEVPVDYQDFDSDDAEYAFLVSDNAIAEWSELDFSAINEQVANFDPGFDLEMLGIKNFTIDAGIDLDMSEELRDDLNKKFIIEVTFPNDMEMMDIHDDLVSRGYIVKIKNK